jgi:hypothetical protein
MISNNQQHMRKSQNRNIGNKRSLGNMTPQKVNNHTIEGLTESEQDESSDAEVRRMMIRMLNELKEDVQKQLNEPKGFQRTPK